MPVAITQEKLNKAVKEDQIMQEVMRDVERGKMGDGSRNSEYAKVLGEPTSWESLLL